MWTTWRLSVVLKLRELYVALIKNFPWHYFSHFVKNAGNWIYQKLRQVHHILHNATVFGVSLLVLVLSGVVLQHLAIKKWWVKGKIIIVGNWLEQSGRDLQWSASPAARLSYCTAQVLIQRLPVSHHTGGACLASGNAGVFSAGIECLCQIYYTQSSAGRADPVVGELYSLYGSNRVAWPVMSLKHHSFCFLSVRALNLYFSSWYIFLNVGLFKNHNDSKCILRASTFHC